MIYVSLYQEQNLLSGLMMEKLQVDSEDVLLNLHKMLMLKQVTADIRIHILQNEGGNNLVTAEKISSLI
jgi:hypothetical protein